MTTEPLKSSTSGPTATPAEKSGDVGRRIVGAALGWIGTAYHHAGDIRKNGADRGGVDCAMILVRVFCDLGLVPMFDPRPYPPDWHLHRDSERFLGWVQEFAVKVDRPAPGDVVMFRFGRAFAHGGIVCAVDGAFVRMIHANQDAGEVELAEVRRWNHRQPCYWRLKP
jgi:cell wall-associated NlpC family hydrolase